MTKDPTEDWVPLSDVSGLTIPQLLASDNPTLRGSIERLLKSIAEDGGAISAFSSFAES